MRAGMGGETREHSGKTKEGSCEIGGVVRDIGYATKTMHGRCI